MAKNENEAKKLAEDEVVVKKDDIKALMKRVEELEKGDKGVVSLDEPEVRYVRVRMWEGKPVSSMSNVVGTSTRDFRGDEIMHCTLHLADGTEVPEVNYLEFLRNCPYDELPITETKAEKRVTDQGVVEVQHVEGFRSVGTGVKVRSRVISYDYTYEVQLKDGSRVKIKQPNL